MKTIIIFFWLAFVSVTALHAQIAPVDDNGLAIGGYDVVAYFTGKATKGKPSITAQHGKATYQFSTVANRDAFVKNPAQYLPQFDGYCAWGVAEKSATFPINPETFDIVDGKLYLFFNGPFNGNDFNTREPWEADQARLLKQANTHWATMTNKR